MLRDLRCDLGINNMLAVRNSKLIRDYCSIDARVRQLIYIIKHWAKRRNINDPFRGTLSSYAYVLMVRSCCSAAGLFLCTVVRRCPPHLAPTHDLSLFSVCGRSSTSCKTFRKDMFKARFVFLMQLCVDRPPILPCLQAIGRSSPDESKVATVLRAVAGPLSRCPAGHAQGLRLLLL